MAKKKVVQKGVQKKDFSNKTVVIMLLLVVVVSILSLGIYLNALDSNNARQIKGENGPDNQVQGVVSMVILPPIQVNETVPPG